MRIAYLANHFPASVEPYVMEEITELRARGIEVLPTSARRAGRVSPGLEAWSMEALYLQSLHFLTLLRSVIRCCSASHQLRPLLRRIFTGPEPLRQRTKALLHTWLGVYYALLLQGENIQHIHVHHGYFSAWIAMVAARLLGITYSLTLHGSDLLLNAKYLDIKLQHCAFCFTVSQYNRDYVLQHYPHVPREKVVLRRLGVEAALAVGDGCDWPGDARRFVLLAVGRLHPVKDHKVLVAACAVLKAHGLDFVCFIAGQGPEKKKLQKQIHGLGLQRQVKLLGHVSHQELEAIYPLADLVVLTSKSEGIPLALMEAMAHGRAVLAPNITGIPELIADGKTGFLYEPGSLSELVARIELVCSSRNALGPLRRAARDYVNTYFNRAVNLRHFAEVLAERCSRETNHADPVLQ